MRQTEAKASQLMSNYLVFLDRKVGDENLGENFLCDNCNDIAKPMSSCHDLRFLRSGTRYIPGCMGNVSRVETLLVGQNYLGPHMSPQSQDLSTAEAGMDFDALHCRMGRVIPSIASCGAVFK